MGVFRQNREELKDFFIEEYWSSWRYPYRSCSQIFL